MTTVAEATKVREGLVALGVSRLADLIMGTAEAYGMAIMWGDDEIAENARRELFELSAAIEEAGRREQAAAA